MPEAKEGKIALFWPTFTGGGVERNNLRVATELTSRGYRVEIVVASAKGELGEGIPDGIPVVNFGISLGNGKLLLALFPLMRYLHRERPAVLWSSMTEANLIALAARLLTGRPDWLIVSERSTLGVRIKGRFRKSFLPLLVRVFYRFADRVHAVSSGVAEDLTRTAGLQRSKIQVVYNPVVTAGLFEKSEEPLDHHWFLPGEPPVVLGVGRLSPAKDFPSLIRAFAKVRNLHPARLLILGEGPERRNLEKLVATLGLEEDVALPGFVGNPFKFMKHANVFVLSSRWEGLPTVLIEALAIGTPVVSTNCPSGAAEILEGGKWGSLVPVGDVVALANAITKSLNEIRPAEIDGGKKRARTFTVEEVVKTYAKLLFPNGRPSKERQLYGNDHTNR